MARQANAAAVERLKAAREKSLKIMQMDMNGSLGKIAESKMNNIVDTVTGAEPKFVSSLPQGAMPQAKSAVRPMQRTTFSPSASKMPSAILESFKANPGGDDNALMREVLAGSDDLSFLNEGTTRLPQQITETVQQPQAQTVQTVSAGVDYPMIRTIVEEIVRKYAGSITKKVLSESKGSNAGTVNTMMLGEKFKFLTDEGDIYECTMKRIGNVKDRKKNVNG